MLWHCKLPVGAVSSARAKCRLRQEEEQCTGRLVAICPCVQRAVGQTCTEQAYVAKKNTRIDDPGRDAMATPSGPKLTRLCCAVERVCPGAARAHCGCSWLDVHVRWGDVRAAERSARQYGAVVVPAACRTLPCTHARCTHVPRGALHRLWLRASQPLSCTCHASTFAASFPKRTSTSVVAANRPRRVHIRHPILQFIGASLNTLPE